MTSKLVSPFAFGIKLHRQLFNADIIPTCLNCSHRGKEYYCKKFKAQVPADVFFWSCGEDNWELDEIPF